MQYSRARIYLGGAFVTRQKSNLLNLCCSLLLFLGLAACTSTPTQDQRARDEKTREEAAKATEKIKPELKEAGKELGQAAREAAEDARAAAQGVKEGWNRDQTHVLNLNTAPESELVTLPGITRTDAQRIVRGRPYRDKKELVSREIVSNAEYDKIRDYISAE
jgi:DNA uptake protein ComE-like DNA-binding protein